MVDDGELIRYVGLQRDPDSGLAIGVFQVASRAKRDEHMPADLRAQLGAALRWFGEHLAVPRRFSHHRDGWRRAAGGAWVRTPLAISWFKPDATVHLARIVAVVGQLRAAGIAVREIRTRRPGYVTYEDRHQVVAVPFSDTRVGDDGGGMERPES
ncbi:MAG: hypothetical protein H0X38_02815 [Planctomycetes bacterium]|nr:hypothetical protein [Planctomycetota bacterium]